jgi:hypothetical protein
LKTPKLLLIIPLLFISILPVLPAAIPRAHAATGVVCLTDAVTTGCPISPEVLFASGGSTLTVLVQIAGSDNLNGFNIQIQTDNTVLQAAGASLTGSILGSGATIVLECLDGVLVAGNACDSTDGPGVLHFAATKTGSTVAGSGQLFSATYNVVSKTPGINVNLMAVTISNGTATPDSETTLNATFSNLTDFGVTPNPPMIQTPPGTTGTSTITFTSFGGFTDFITVSVTCSAGLTCSTTDTGQFLAPDSSFTETLSVSSAVVGSYSATVTGTGSNPLFTHSVTVPVTVTPQDFSISASPNTLNLAPGNSGTSTINVGSISGFTGTVMLSASSALGTSFSSSSVAAPGTSVLTISTTSSTAPGPYMVTVTGVSGTLTHSATIMVTVGVPDFSFVSVPGEVVVFRNDPFSTAASSLNLASINNFAATVSITATISFAFVSTPGSASLPFAMSSSVMLPAGGTASDTFVATVAKATAGTGLYVVSFSATGGGKTHTTTLQIWVIDFTVSAQDSVVTMANVPGTFGQDPLTIGAIGAPFNETGFNVNPGFTEGTAQFPLVYYSTSGSGPKFNATSTGLDTSFTSQRCFLEVFDSHGNLIMPVVANGKVQSFAGPLVHLNGDQFGFPPNGNGCRFDSFWYVDPLNGNAFTNFFPGGTDTNLVTIEPLLTTPLGTYTALVCLQAGGDINCVNITINMVAPPVAPALDQFTGRTPTVSLAAGGIGNFKVGVFNQDPSRTVYVSVTITAVSLDGTITVTATSGVVAIPAGSKVNNIPISIDLSAVPAGTTLNENLVINYGVAPHYLTLTSTQTIGTSLKLTGSIVVTP